MKHASKAAAEAMADVPSKPLTVKQAERLSRIVGRGYEIGFHPVSQWGGLILESDADIREEVREYLAKVYRARQTEESLQARIDAGTDVVIDIAKEGKA